MPRGNHGVLPTALFAACLAAGPLASRADGNLIPNGSFESADGDPLAAFRCANDGGAGGRFELFTEDLTWNRCGKLTAGAIHKEPAGGRVVDVFSGSVRVGGAEHGAIPVEPDMPYAYSFDVRGTVDFVHFSYAEYRMENGREVKAVTGKGAFAVGPDWKRFSGTFRTRPDTVRLSLNFLVWTEVYPNGTGQFKSGDYLLLDNLSLVRAERQARLVKALKETKENLLVAPIPVETDPACPFLPLELAEAPTQIVLRAAVNEKKPLPVAIGNMTDRFEQYRVILETEPRKIPGSNVVPDCGEFGLEGFPPGKITVREALRFKATDADPAPLRLDPLVEMNGASVLSVPPREAGVVWFDFDTYDVKPGTYRGRLRVIPLGTRAKYAVKDGRHVRLRSGERFLPVTLTVDPIVLPREAVRPAHLCSPCQSAQGFGLEADIGGRIYALGTYLICPEAVGNPQSAVRRMIDNYRRWAADRGVKIVYFVKYDAYRASQDIFNAKKDPARRWSAWEDYVRTLAKIMEEAGVACSDYYVLVRDEPKNAELEMVREAQERLKRVCPAMRTYVSVGHNIEGPVDYVDCLGPTTDLWAPGDRIFGEPATRTRLLELKAKRGAKLLHYRCSTSVAEPLVGYFRAHCWRGERWNVDADMIYQFNIYNPGRRGDWSFKVAPQGELSYKTGDTFHPSVRYMAYREGVTDIRYLAKLREAGGDDPEVRAFIEDAVGRMTAVCEHDAAEPARIRTEMADLILRKQTEARKR